MMAILATMACAQKSYNSEQKDMRDKAFDFLRDEGFQPSIDNDGDIMFWRGGKKYYIIVSDKDNSPFYLSLSIYFDYSDHLSKSKLLLYSSEINKYKMLKLYLSDNTFSLQCQMFLTNIESFTAIFNRVLGIIDSAEDELSKL